MKVYVLTMTYQMGQGDDVATQVVGVFDDLNKAERAMREVVDNEIQEFEDSNRVVSDEDGNTMVMIMDKDDDAYWTEIRLHQKEVE